MFDSILNLINQIVNAFVLKIAQLFNGLTISDVGFNIYLFSDTGWFTRPILMLELVGVTTSIFMFIFILRLLWKGTKKFIRLVLGVFRL